MSIDEFNDRIRGHMHHRIIITLDNGDVINGHMQPNDGVYTYLTLPNNTGFKCLISSIRSLYWPEGVPY